MLLPVKEDGLDQGDDVPAGIVPGADDGHVDRLRGEEHRMSTETGGGGPPRGAAPGGSQSTLL